MSKQSGNALFLILIAVAMFAALSYAITSSSRGGGSIEKEQAEITASQITQYGTALESAIQRLQLINGCSDTQISLWNDSDGNGAEDSSDDYFNPTSPSDKSCHVFHPNGGNIASRTSAELGAKFLIFPNDVCVSGVGSGPLGDACRLDGLTSDTDLILGLGEIEESVCASINQNLGVNGIPTDGGNTYSSSPALKFAGTYTEFHSITNFTSNDIMPMSGCVTPDAAPANRYNFYHVLIPR